MAEGGELMSRLVSENADLKRQVRLLKENQMLKRLLSESCPERGRGAREPLLPRAPAYPEDCSPGAAGEARAPCPVLSQGPSSLSLASPPEDGRPAWHPSRRAYPSATCTPALPPWSLGGPGAGTELLSSSLCAGLGCLPPSAHTPGRGAEGEAAPRSPARRCGGPWEGVWSHTPPAFSDTQGSRL